MVNPIEREPESKIPEDIVERPESLPERLEKEQRLKVRPTQFKKQVTDDRGKSMIHTPKAKTVTISLPADQQKLTSWSKGPITSSLTWFGVFWLRLIKKAIHFGWKIKGMMVPVKKPEGK
jgi:hypothetical protein